jgi:hypothetical protein
MVSMEGTCSIWAKMQTDNKNKPYERNGKTNKAIQATMR